MVATHDPAQAVGVEKVSKKIMETVKAGGLREVTAEEMATAQKKTGKSTGKKATDPAAANTATKLKSINNKQLLAYYKENFSTTKEDLEAFSKMGTEEKVQFLLEDED